MVTACYWTKNFAAAKRMRKGLSSVKRGLFGRKTSPRPKRGTRLPNIAPVAIKADDTRLKKLRYKKTPQSYFDTVIVPRMEMVFRHAQYDFSQHDFVAS